MSKHSVIVIIVVLLVGGIALSFSNRIVLYNNTTPKELLITKEYSNSQILEMIERIDRQLYDKYEFLKCYDIECLRKSARGYYAIFKQDDGKYVYVFLYNDFIPVANATLIVDRFKSKGEFLSFTSVERTMLEMTEYDSTTLFPFSGRNASIHHVVEGVILVDYYSNITPWNAAKVASIEFTEDSTLLQIGDDLNIPYILSIDRKN